jgi:hypothetical protein
MTTRRRGTQWMSEGRKCVSLFFPFFLPLNSTEHFLPQQQYSNLFFLLQSEPRHIASLCRLVSLSEIDTLLQTVMFTLYGNQYESREEHLLLTMFQVCSFCLFLRYHSVT